MPRLPPADIGPRSPALEGDAAGPSATTMPPILTFATAGSYEIGRHQPTHYALGTKVAVNVA